ncbi:hypothetical protein MMPV_003374 [Pyropia vietnamensis]
MRVALPLFPAGAAAATAAAPFRMVRPRRSPAAAGGVPARSRPYRAATASVSPSATAGAVDDDAAATGPPPPRAAVPNKLPRVTRSRSAAATATTAAAAATAEVVPDPLPDASAGVPTSLGVPAATLAAADAGDRLALEAWLHAAGHHRVAGIDEAGRGPWAGPVVAAAVVLHSTPSTPGKESTVFDLAGVRDSKKLTAATRARLLRALVAATRPAVTSATTTAGIPDGRVPYAGTAWAGDTRGGLRGGVGWGGPTAGVEFGVGVVPATIVDAVNVLQATRLAMAAAVAALPGGPPDALLVDGPRMTVPGGGGVGSGSHNGDMVDGAGGSDNHGGVSGGHRVAPPPVAVQVALKGADDRSAAVALASVVAKETRDALMRDADTVWPGYGFGRHAGYGTRAHAAALRSRGACAIHRLTYKPVRAVVEAAAAGATATAAAAADDDAAGPPVSSEGGK